MLLYKSKTYRISEHDEDRKEQAVYSIQYASVARENPSTVLYARATLQH